MGDFYEHVLFGLLLSAVTAYLLKDVVSLTGAESVMAVIAVFVGSVLPDIDNKNAYVHRAIKAFISIVAGGMIFLLSPVSLTSRFVLGSAALLAVHLSLKLVKIKHRGVTHTISFCTTISSLAVIAGVYLFGSAVPGIALGLGLASHLVLDSEFRL